MNNLSLKPSDIKSPYDFPTGRSKHVYLNCLGKTEYEIIAQRLVEASQAAGEWVFLPEEAFVSVFDQYIHPIGEVRCRLEQMLKESSHLKKERDWFALTPFAIKQLFKKYPAEKKS